MLEAGVYKTAETPKGIHEGWESPLCELRGYFWGTGFRRQLCITRLPEMKLLKRKQMKL